MVAHFVDLSRHKVEYEINAFPSNPPAANCRLLHPGPFKIDKVSKRYRF